MSEGEQVFCCLIHSVDVLSCYKADRVNSRISVKENNRNDFVMNDLPDHSTHLGGWDYYDPIYVDVNEFLDDLGFLVWITVTIAEDDCVVIKCCDTVYSDEYHGKELVFYIRHNEAYQTGSFFP